MAASLQDRRALLRRQLLRLGTFATLVRELAKTPDEPRHGEEIRTLLATLLPGEPPAPLLRTVVNWARHAQLFDGDRVPITTGGRSVAIVWMLLSVLFVSA